MVFQSKCLRVFLLVAGFTALSLNLFGFISPNWIVLKRSFVEQTATIFRKELIDVGGVRAPAADEEAPMRAKRSVDEEIIEEEVIEENNELIVWFQNITIETTEYDVRMHYGLWSAKLCVHERNIDGDSDSSSDEDDHKKHGGKHRRGKKGHCRCKKISIKCALLNAFMFEDSIDFINPGPPSKRVLSQHNYGYASLTEQRVENCLSLAFLFLGVVFSIGAFKKAKACRCAAYMCIVFMLLSALLALVPVTRFGHYSVFKHSQRLPIHVSLPASVFATGAGAVLCVLITLITGCGLAMNSRQEKPGHWYKFNNELELPIENEEKKPQLVFYTEPLPEKSDE